MKRISIIIPYYNSLNTIERCLLSIPRERNLEIIIVDDGSQDPVKFNNDTIKEDSRIRIISIPHIGVSGARNVGIQNATGDYIHFVDSDDTLLPRIKDIYQQETVADILVFGAKVELLSNRFCHKSVLPSREIVYDNPKKAFFEEDSCKPYVWNCLYKRSFIIKNRLLFNENLVIGEDIAFQIEAFSIATACHFLPIEGYVYYFGNPTSTIYYYLQHPYERVRAHLALQKEIKDSLIKRKIKMQGYCEWMVSFVYFDFLELSLNEQMKLAPLCRSVFANCRRIDNVSWKNCRHILIMRNNLLKIIRKGIREK